MRKERKKLVETINLKKKSKCYLSKKPKLNLKHSKIKLIRCKKKWRKGTRRGKHILKSSLGLKPWKMNRKGSIKKLRYWKLDREKSRYSRTKNVNFRKKKH